MINPEDCCSEWEKKRVQECDLSSARFEQAENDIKYLIEYFTEEKRPAE